MECFNHPGEAAVGTCQKCGKALCQACFGRFNPPLCEPCLIAHNDSVASSLWVDLVITIVIFCAVSAFAIYNLEDQKHTGLIFGLVAAGAYWGYQFMGSIPMVKTILLGGRSAYLFALVFQLVFAILLGFIVMPWQIFKRVKEIVTIKKLKKMVMAGEA